ncbi:MAG: hypothetical protein ACYCXW_07240, partial [Solirubrobacteraceae bacterium]
LFLSNSLGQWTMEAFIMGIFFLASAGASAAYLTVSEIFPMETRALAIAFFYAIGTAAGGITGPLVFSNFISAGHRGLVALAFGIGLGLMALGGIAELVLGVKAEQRSLEDIAKPLTADEAQEGAGQESDGVREAKPHDGSSDGAAEPETDPEYRRALAWRRSALEERARAAEQGSAHQDLVAEEEQSAAAAAELEQRAERQQAAQAREQRIRQRLERRQRRDQATLGRFRPGPGRGFGFYSPGMVGSSGASGRDSVEVAVDREVQAIGRALAEHGALDQHELARLVGARYWGPGRFREAVAEALEEGLARRVSRRTLAPPEQHDKAS